jgi:hypothetical protein
MGRFQTLEYNGTGLKGLNVKRHFLQTRLYRSDTFLLLQYSATTTCILEIHMFMEPAPEYMLEIYLISCSLTVHKKRKILTFAQHSCPFL